MVGENARQHPELLEAIAAAGHEVALHSYSHEPVEGRSPDDVSADLQATARAVRDAGIEPASLFRPPRGLQDVVGAEAVCRHGLRTIGWLINVNELTEARMDELQPGAIVLAHDGRHDRSLDVTELDRLLRHLAARGIHGVSTGELVAAAAVTPAG